MKKLILLLLMTTTFSITAQTAYEQGMQKGLEYWANGENDKAIATYDRIAQVEKTNWIPYYYSVQVSINSSLGEKDRSKRELLLKKASKTLDIVMGISPNNSELYSLKGLLLTAYVAFNPMVNGAKLSGETMMTFEKSIQLDSTNPRPYYLKGQFQMGAARFFKQDLTPYCEEVEKSIEIFNNFKPKGKYYPNWGKERAMKILNSSDCKTKSGAKIDTLGK